MFAEVRAASCPLASFPAPLANPLPDGYFTSRSLKATVRQDGAVVLTHCGIFSLAQLAQALKQGCSPWPETGFASSSARCCAP